MNDISKIILGFAIALIFLFAFRYYFLPSVNWIEVHSAQHQPYAEVIETTNGVAIRWWSGWDTGFMGDMKIDSNHGSITIPLPDPGGMVYLNGSYKSNDTVIFVMDNAVQTWICVGNCQ